VPITIEAGSLLACKAGPRICRALRLDPNVVAVLTMSPQGTLADCYVPEGKGFKLTEDKQDVEMVLVHVGGWRALWGWLVARWFVLVVGQ
jgi:hypothetical protein